MPNQVVILHGWSDSSKSFEPLAKFLAASGIPAVPLWLGDYISLDDDVKVQDVAKRMQVVLQEKVAVGELRVPFDVIVHSTGALVAREWLAMYYGATTSTPPVRRLVMLAPANHGSKLASMGQSMLGRVVKGFNNWFHTGKEMLRALELSSPYLWELASRDLFVPDGIGTQGSAFRDDAVLPFVITGTHPYPDLLRQIVNENGSDGTVRVPAANLNSRGLTLDFTGKGDPVSTDWPNRFQRNIPLAVLPTRTHGSIIQPDGGDVKEETAEQKARLGQLIFEALNCDTVAEYDRIQASWFALSEQTVDKTSEPFHQYVMVNVLVVDDNGVPVPDYFLEFSGTDADVRSDDATVYFHRNVLEAVHPNGQGSERRCLYIDRTDLLDNFYGRIKSGEKILAISLSANPPGDNVRYFDSVKEGASGSFKLHSETVTNDRWLRRNTTHYVKIIIPRQPIDKVFRIRTP